MDKIDVTFCLYDDSDYVSDADRDSRRLKDWHQQLGSKKLPNGNAVERHLDNVLAFADSRNLRIRRWCAARNGKWLAGRDTVVRDSTDSTGQ